jgi:hypothetical protein
MMSDECSLDMTEELIPLAQSAGSGERKVTHARPEKRFKILRL